MLRLRRLPFIALITAGLVTPTAVAASTSPTSDAAIPHITVDKPFSLVLDSHGKADTAKLPTTNTVFTKKELTQAIRGLSATSVSGDTQTLTINGDATNTLSIVLKRFGSKESVTSAWNSEKHAHESRAHTYSGLYTFYGSKLGAADAFTDGTNTHVLVTSGDAAGEIWFSGAGFTKLSDSYSDSRATYTDRIVPALVRLLADKATAGAKQDAAAQAKAKDATPSLGGV